MKNLIKQLYRLFLRVSFHLDVKTFLEKHDELAPQLRFAKSVDEVVTAVKESCTVIDIACFKAIIDRYNIEIARPHVANYKSAIDEIREKFKQDVVEKKKLNTDSLYEEIVFVLEWHRMNDDLAFNDIDDFLQKGFGNMAKRILFNYGLKRKLFNNEV